MNEKKKKKEVEHENKPLGKASLEELKIDRHETLNKIMRLKERLIVLNGLINKKVFKGGEK